MCSPCKGSCTGGRTRTSSCSLNSQLAEKVFDSQLLPQQSAAPSTVNSQLAETSSRSFTVSLVVVEVSSQIIVPRDMFCRKNFVCLPSSSTSSLSISTPHDYFRRFSLTTFVGGYIGKSKVDKWVQKNNLTSALVVLLCAEISLAAILVTIVGLQKYADRDWRFEGFQNFCG